MGHDVIPHHHPHDNLEQTKHENENKSHQHSGLADVFAHFQHEEQGLVYLGTRMVPAPYHFVFYATNIVLPFTISDPCLIAAYFILLPPPDVIPDLSAHYYISGLRAPPALLS